MKRKKADRLEALKLADIERAKRILDEQEIPPGVEVYMTDEFEAAVTKEDWRTWLKGWFKK
jgi:hypothetical protein